MFKNCLQSQNCHHLTGFLPFRKKKSFEKNVYVQSFKSRLVPDSKIYVSNGITGAKEDVLARGANFPHMVEKKTLSGDT